jgi:predicted GH43/DUF377 family glycosyl hydrolase
MDQGGAAQRRWRRLGIVMEPEPADPREAGGVLNPAVTRGPDGHLYLLPRLVAAGNYSRIGLARVLFNRRGRPIGVERLGVVLEPRVAYEMNSRNGGGVEDPRVTYIAAHGLYVMTYTAFGEAGPRIAAAISRDLRHWRRIGLVRFAPYHGLDLGAHDNKDALLFPEPVRAPDGRPALALIHRPTFTMPGSAAAVPLPEHRPSMWISYAPLDEVTSIRRVIFGQHHLLAAPQQGWERLKVGGGTPPVRIGDRWLVLYHGVSGRHSAGREHHVRYCGGALLLDGSDPRRVSYRSTRSLLVPRAAAERSGVVPRVVFPTGLDTRDDGTVDVYYGMADSRIGVVRAALDTILSPAAAQAA